MVRQPGPPPRGRTAVKIALGLWGAVFLGAFVAFAVTAPTDFGLTKGMNRVTTFFGWQFAAAFLSLGSAYAAWSLPRGSRWRRLGLIPLYVTATLVVALAGLILWAKL